jgi:hypothetical protein
MLKTLRGERAGGTGLLVIIGVLGIVLIAVAFTARQVYVDQTNTRLCNVLYTVIAQSGATVGEPGSPGYEYYRSHPVELETARRQNREFLEQLPC